jgi:hypothetical protein
MVRISLGDQIALALLEAGELGLNLAHPIDDGGLSVADTEGVDDLERGPRHGDLLQPAHQDLGGHHLERRHDWNLLAGTG